jgi:hypothetical protein
MRGGEVPLGVVSICSWSPLFFGCPLNLVLYMPFRIFVYSSIPSRPWVSMILVVNFTAPFFLTFSSTCSFVLSFLAPCFTWGKKRTEASLYLCFSCSLNCTLLTFPAQMWSPFLRPHPVVPYADSHSSFCVHKNKYKKMKKNKNHGVSPFSGEYFRPTV